MAEKIITPDTMMKTYWSGNEEFADFYNAALFDGEPVIRPEELSALDSDSSIVIERQEYAESLHRVRDLIKVHKRTGSSSPVLLGMENQTYICYPMPLRQMGYDYTSYHKEYMVNAGECKKDKTLDSNEFLSRMKRTDRLPPPSDNHRDILRSGALGWSHQPTGNAGHSGGIHPIRSGLRHAAD